MKKSVLLFGLIVMSFIACNNETFVEVPSLDTSEYSYIVKGKTIPEEFAVEEAIKLRKLFGDEPETRCEELMVENVQVATNRQLQRLPDTRIGGENAVDSIVYLVNFKDNKGYVLLSAQPVEQAILAISTSGSLDLNVAPVNPNQCAALINTEANLDMDYSYLDKEHGGTGTTINPYYTRYGQWELVSSCDPLLKSKWGQDMPFNLKLERIDGQFPRTGCVATATAQIMAYHQKPANYHWEMMIRNPLLSPGMQDLGNLFYDLGKRLDVQYGLEKSDAYSEKVPTVLSSYGYFNGGTLADYDDGGSIFRELDHSYPVYTGGSSIMKVKRRTIFLFWEETTFYYEKGHAWVIDGYKILRRKVESVNRFTGAVVSSRYDYSQLVHCNMGDQGTGDGYYQSRIFDTNKGPLPENSETRSITESGTEGYYQFKLHLITNIRP